MTANRVADLWRGVRAVDSATDADLLARFAAGRDGEAFAELVRRHGPLVLGVCRRVAGHAQDAEDAFQAAFLVLARKAAAVRRPELLGNWLYGVAYRVARRAKRAAARRRKREVQVPTPPDPPAPAADAPADLAAVLDAELAALPDRINAVLELAYRRAYPAAVTWSRSIRGRTGCSGGGRCPTTRRCSASARRSCRTSPRC